MALIYTYPELQVPIPDDLLLISDSSTQYKQTRSIKFSNLSNAIVGSGTPDFLTKWDSSGTRLEDSIVKQEAGTGYGSTGRIAVNGNIYQPNMSDSVSIDDNALKNATVVVGVPGENIAIGKDALSDVTTATGNVAIGPFAGFTLNSNNNIAIGKNSQLNNISGGGNISLGFNSLDRS